MNEGRLFRSGVFLWILVAALIGGVYVALAAMKSPEGVYTSAIIPISLLAAVCGLFYFDRGEQSVAPVLLLAAYFLPFRFSTGTQSVLVDSLLITCGFVGLFVLRKIILKERILLKRSNVNVPTLGFVSVTILSLIWSIIFRDPHVNVWDRFLLVQIAAGLVMVMLPLAMILTANTIHDLSTIRWMAGLTIAAGIVGILVDPLGISIPSNTFGLIGMWIITISISMGIFYRRLWWFLRLLLLALAGWWLYKGFVLNLYWIAGWLPSLLAIIVLSFMRSWRALLVILVVIFMLIGPNLEFYLGTFIQQEAQESLYTRLDAWEVTWHVVKDHLLLGTGPGGYAVYFMTYFPTRAMATHNNYFDVIAQTGIVGLGFLLWLLARLIASGIGLHRRLRGTGILEEAIANASLAGLTGTIVIMMFGDWLLPFAYTQTIAGFDHIVPTWVFMGVIVALDHMVPRANETLSPSATT